MIARLFRALALLMLVGCQRKVSPIEKDPTPPPSVSAQPSADPLAPPKDCPPDMAGHPGGGFKMLREGWKLVIREEDLVRVEVKPFCLDKTEVTVEAYNACFKAGLCSEPWKYDPDPREPAAPSLQSANWKHPDPTRLKHPVNGVTWQQAVDYCKWKGRRLPAHQEVEWAMRGGPKGTKYPWGNDPITKDRANLGDRSWWDKCMSRMECFGLTFPEDYWSDGYPFSAPVGSFPAGANPWGVLDLVGNVEEWTAPFEVDDEGRHLYWAKGGSYSTHPVQFYFKALASTRYGLPYDGATMASVGFRCAR